MSSKKPTFYRVNAVRYDDVLRMSVPSRKPRTPPYLVELDAYDCNGRCVCKHFTVRLEPILKRGITAEQAFAGGLAEVPEWGTVEDCLRCFHVHVARLKFADDTIRAVNHDRTSSTPR